MLKPVSKENNAPDVAQSPVIEVLFLCTGNYYRSRLAEELFNHYAAAQALSCRATSLGFTPHPERNPGTISIFTLKALSGRKIAPQAAERLPAAVQAKDFLTFRNIIAM